jgi:nitrite reductase/ring-hydroxylating ferredoxin subunit
VETGRVVSGPAEERIETYDVEIEKGNIFVKPKRSREHEDQKAA